MHRRILLLGVVALAMAALSASCGRSGPTSSQPTATTAAQPGPPTSTPGTAPATSVPVAGARCQNDQVSVVPLSGGAGAGSAEEVIGFTNVTPTTCTLTGYPGVAALDGSGAQVAQARRTTGGPSTPVTTVALAQGQTASATVSGTSIPTGTATRCPYYAPALLVTPPDLTRSVRVAVTGSNLGQTGFPGCGVLTVGPVVPGITGQS
jgi:hypothetical protein